MEDLLSSYRPIWVSERIQKAFFTIVDVLCSSCTYVFVPGVTLKAGFRKVLHACLSVRWTLKATLPLVHASLRIKKGPEWRVYDCRGSVKLVKASLRVRKYIECHFHLCGGLVNLVDASLSVRNDSEIIFLHCGSPVKLFYICFTLRRVLESCFYYCGGPVKVVQSTLCDRNDLESHSHHVAVLCRLFTSVCVSE